jgi:hypothetical protein
MGSARLLTGKFVMRFACSALVWVALVVGGGSLLRCDDDAEVVQQRDAARLPEPGSRGAGGAEGDEEDEAARPRCVPSECPALMALGSVVPGCCQNDGSCGGLVLLNGSPLCAPPNVDNLVAGAGPTLMQLQEEPVAVDAACAERVILGTSLPGCCDQTGVCGVSTAPVASGSPGAIPGLDLPLTCISPAEAARLGGGMAALGAGVPQPCGAATSATDAGAAPAPGPDSAPPVAPPPAAGDAGASDAGS